MLGPGDDREMILSDRQWPLLTLPVKRRVPNNWPELGVIENPPADDKSQITVHVNQSPYGPLSGPQEEKTYDNVDALLEDGWIVD